MGIIVNDRNEKSELQQRITAELREKQLRTSNRVDEDLRSDENIKPENTAYMKDLKPTTTLSWAWLLIGLAIVGVIIAIILITT